MDDAGAELDWDDAIEEAWTTFRAVLADRLASMGEGEAEVLTPETPDDGPAASLGYCQVVVDDGRLLVEAASDEFLRPDRRLGAEQLACLVALGLAAPEPGGSPNHWVDLDQREADRAAWLITSALREVYGVLHPAYLQGVRGLAEPDEAEAAPGPSVPPDAGPWPMRHAGEVRAAVHRVVRDVLGRDPVWDDDGELPLASERGVLYVVPAHRAPRMLLSAVLLTEVTDRRRALVEVNRLNRQHFGLTFLVDDDHVVVRRELAVGSFVPDEVRAEISRIWSNLDAWVSELQPLLGGRGWFDDSSAPPHDVGDDRVREDAAARAQERRYRDARAVMRELERGARTDVVDPATLARVFLADRDLVMRAITESRSRERRAHRRARELDGVGQIRSARLQRARAAYQRGLRRRLRGALRITVGGQERRDADQLALFAAEEVGS